MILMKVIKKPLKLVIDTENFGLIYLFFIIFKKMEDIQITTIESETGRKLV